MNQVKRKIYNNVLKEVYVNFVEPEDLKIQKLKRYALQKNFLLKR